VCPTPNPEQYPITVMPFMAGYEEICPDCDAKGTPCCSLDSSQCCVDLTTIRTAIACRPRWATCLGGLLFCYMCALRGCNDHFIS
jgi:hypothetical protein